MTIFLRLSAFGLKNKYKMFQATMHFQEGTTENLIALYKEITETRLIKIYLLKENLIKLVL